MIRIVAIFAVLAALSACGDMPAATSPNGPVPAPENATTARLKGKSPSAIVSAIRAKTGLGPVRRSARLDRVALMQARDMAQNDFFSHSGSDGSSVGNRARRGGYDWCVIAENINKGYPDIRSAILAWETSRSHYRNMTLRGAKEFGIASVGSYNVMVLGARDC
ncbi:CAP domain-containing protein [Sulfitobacter sp. HNIBRBA3233]|uniref:CAP domain-containing protein n=1 Tax=Sulfitobacter marinivivus TaxID=3158558 RepID=UPI0032E04ECF